MNGSRLTGFLILTVSAVVFIFGGIRLTHISSNRFLDFKALYYGTRCYISGCDPYNVSELDHYFTAIGGAQHEDSPAVRDVVTHFVNLPTVFIFTVPFAMAPWSTACLLWTGLTCASYVCACFLIWSVCAPQAPIASATLIGVLIASSQTIFAGGNAVGLVVSLTAIAAWCFIRGRMGWIGALCIAVALLLKPHDAGPIWFFFLLAGSTWRRRALQSISIAAALAFVATLWAFHTAPHWFSEQQANLALLSAPGGMNSPVPGASVDRSSGMLIDLQALLAVFNGSPRFYNSATYLLCGAMLLLWMCKAINAESAERTGWFGLAAIVPLSMLITYHKPYDLKLMLLAIPACILLWIKADLRGQAAYLLTLGAIFFCADVPLGLYAALTDSVHPNLHTLSGKLLAVLILRPVSLILIALTAFYLGLWLRSPLSSAARS